MTEPKTADRRALRRELRRLWESVPMEERRVRDDGFFRALTALLGDRIGPGKIGLAYLGTGFEPDTARFVEACLQKGCRMGIPVCLPERGMCFREIPSREALLSLQPGAYGIPEPPETWPELTDADWMLTPGLGFTPKGGRMGRGGGYYDRFLSAHPTLFTVALCMESCLRENLPLEEHDMPVCRVLLPDGRVF